MDTTELKSINKTEHWELNTLTYAYLVIAFFAALFVYMTYRVGLLIKSPQIKPSTYFETHIIIDLLEVLIWVISAKAAIRLKTYARSIRSSIDGKALDYISDALLLIVLYAILFSMASTAKALFINTSHYKTANIISSHLPLLVILIASIYLLIGSFMLMHLVAVEFRSLFKPVPIILFIAFLIFVVTYAMYFYHMASHFNDEDGLPHFNQSSKALLLTYALPYSLTWLMGLIACINLSRYAHKVEGVIYKSLFKYLYIGITLDFVATYLAQLLYVTNINFNKFSPSLLVIFGLLCLLVISNIMIYRGSNQLYFLDTE